MTHLSPEPPSIRERFLHILLEYSLWGDEYHDGQADEMMIFL